MKYLYENEFIVKDASALITKIEQTPALHDYFDSNYGKIKPKTNYCGFLSVEGESYFIVPKIVDNPTQNLNIFIYMLIYAYDIKLKNEDVMDGENQEHHIFELFIRLFTDTLLGEFKKGVFKEYISMEENLKVLRGKYIIEKNFNNFYHQNIYCEFDEFSMDNELNQFFLYAIKTFKKFSSYSNLHRCEAVLDEVASIPIDHKRLNLQFDRMNSRYKKSYEVACMILDKLVPMTQTSQDKSFAFLFDMAKVFEKFVERMYVEIDPTAKRQYFKKFNNLHLKPDIYTKNKIIDVKYKSYDKSGVNRDDKYQTYVYGKNFGIEDTMILYPKHKNDVHEKLKLGEGEEMVSLKLRSLDLGFDSGYDEFVGEIRERLENMNES